VKVPGKGTFWAGFSLSLVSLMLVIFAWPNAYAYCDSYWSNYYSSIRCRMYGSVDIVRPLLSFALLFLLISLILMAVSYRARRKAQ
jgi:hypothetical protein